MWKYQVEIFFLFFLMPFSGVGFFLFTYGSFRHLVGLLGWGISPAPGPLPTQDNTTQKHRHTSMPRAGFEPAIPMFEQPKTVHVLKPGRITPWYYLATRLSRAARVRLTITQEVRQCVNELPVRLHFVTSTFMM
jgi:hypothetical protein